MELTLPRWAVDILSAMPQSGDGFHSWLFRAARALWQCGRDENEIRLILENAASTCGRCVPNREIADAVRNSKTGATQPHTVQHGQWPALNREQREAVIHETKFSLVDLWEASPVRLEDNNSHTEEIVDALFPGDPLLCVGRSNHEFATRLRSEWRGGLAALQLIVPSPMMKRIGLTQDGKESAHTLEATGARRFLVVEQDTGTIDDQAAVLWHLAGYAPLTLIVHSGSKSVHGWFYCSGQSEAKILYPFFWYAVLLGADPSTWTRSQFVRMPDGTRANGKRQTVFYFRPEVAR
jgi:hypothetical protein